jgi:hypothetical protein
MLLVNMYYGCIMYNVCNVAQVFDEYYDIETSHFIMLMS